MIGGEGLFHFGQSVLSLKSRVDIEMSSDAGIYFISEQGGLGLHQVGMRFLAATEDFSEVIVNGGVIVDDEDAIIGQSDRLGRVVSKGGGDPGIRGEATVGMRWPLTTKVQ
jgi:hypothetical protein